MSSKTLAKCCVFVLLVILLPSAEACPDGQYEQCIFGACVCLPEAHNPVPDVANGLNHVVSEADAQQKGIALMAWIQASHDSAIGSANPMPPQIRQLLTGYIEDDILNRAKYKVGDNGVLNLAGLTVAYGDRVNGGSQVLAVTLVDLIVFRDSNAAADPALWAHELTHVKQYRNWGVKDFAIRYARDSSAVENEAYAVQGNYSAWRSSHTLQTTSGNTNGIPTYANSVRPTGLQSGIGMQTCGCWGATAPVAPEPRCASGSVRVNVCAGACPGGGSPYAWLCQ